MLIFHTLIDRDQERPQSELRIAKDYEQIKTILLDFIYYATFSHGQLMAMIKGRVIEHIEKGEWDQEYIMTFGPFQCQLSQNSFIINEIHDMSRWQAEIIDTDTTSETNFYLN